MANRPLADGQRAELLDRIYKAIAPVDIAGLANPQCRNWHPARAEDLLGASGKLGATREEIIAMLNRCGFKSAS
jgi:hypothetical protein